MKKLLILQIKGNDMGGVWIFNKTLSEALVEKKFQIEIISIRNNLESKPLSIDSRIKVHTINENSPWEIPHKSDVLNSLKSKNLKTFFKTFKSFLEEKKRLNLDYDKLKDYIEKYKPDYIISSHYECLNGIPESYLKKTIAIQHSSLKDVFDHTKNKIVLQKYSKKIYKMVWLSKNTAEIASKSGFLNNTYMYNPVRFTTSKKADVVKNKKLIAVTRIENDIKRVNLMVEIANDILKELPDWTFEIYGMGEFTKKSLHIIENNEKIKYMGTTNEPEKVFLTASINLNTSLYEGFCLSILEANMCGVPTICFNFGESSTEEIINKETGIIIENDNILEYKEKLIELMKNEKVLKKMATNAKEFVKKFTIDKISEEWINLFMKMDKE